VPDPRFFRSLPALSVGDLASRIGAEVVRGADRMISAVAPLASAGAGDLGFFADRRFRDALGASGADAVVIAPGLEDAAPADAAVLVSRTPQAAWAQASLIFHQTLTLDAAAAPADCVEDETVVIEPGVVLGQGVRIGRGSRIGANTVIGPGVQIGRDCRIGANVSVSFALIGDRVTLFSGARIGEAGFGATGSSLGVIDIPQLGRVILQDGVTIGANTCVDRGAYADTVIGENTKIDNLVMIGHNCVIGRNVLIAGHTGLSGSVTVADGVMFGGQAGVGDHITIGTGARVAAGGGVLKNIPAGETWSGYPARPHKEALRASAALFRLPALMRRLEKLLEQAKL
jgi:UDP-3-O-[3-hydroxymyristoyl] glucosamine N-acyltransferase